MREGKQKTLHILKKKTNAYALELIEKQTASDRIAILLIQDAAGLQVPDLQADFAVLANDLMPAQETPYKKIGYAEMLALVFASDTIKVW